MVGKIHVALEYVASDWRFSTHKKDGTVFLPPRVGWMQAVRVLERGGWKSALCTGVLSQFWKRAVLLV